MLRQDNSCDCGVFVLQYVEEVVNFVQKRSLSQRIVRKNFEGCLAAFDQKIRTAKNFEIIEDMNQKQADAESKALCANRPMMKKFSHSAR